MPTTQQIVTWVNMQTGWNRDGVRGILPILNEVNTILCQVKAEQFLYFDPTTGSLPILHTTAGVYSYNFPSNIWCVGEIVIQYPLQNFYDLYPLSNYGFKQNLIEPIEDIWIGGRRYLRFKQVRTWEKSGSNPAKILFTVDPGLTSDIFAYAGYTLPTPITSENIQVGVPDRFHLSHVMPAILKMIEGYQTNTVSEAREYIIQRIRPQIIEEMNKGPQGGSGHVRRRGF